MVSRIAENVPNEFMSIEHLGMTINGVEDYDSAEVKRWAGALENYTLTENNGQTTLLIEMDMNADPKMIAYFENTWPQALAKVKALAEKE